ncbi:MAG: protein kinase [bacterium]|nr:protein kinase [bacterium]
MTAKTDQAVKTDQTFETDQPAQAGQTGETNPAIQVDRATQADEHAPTILVVDDNPVTRVLCVRVLGREGYRVLVAEDGIEALRLVKEEAIDLVLLDVMMPGLSGFDVLETLRKLYPATRLRIVMLTAKDQSDNVIRAFELGADDYITKPLDVPVLAARIRVQLRSMSAQVPASEASSSPFSREPGSVLEGKYRLESVIGNGSFGTVYRATHLALERPVALKVFNTGLRSSSSSPTRFLREAISSCRVDHPNAVSVLDLSIVPTGEPFMVMELLEGRSLAEVLKQAGTLSPERCAEILGPICEVLGDAHRLGIIHRDVKPQNVFLHRSRQGEVVKVLDFGIAKLMNDSALKEKLTLDGVVGTPAYMAPERFSGGPCDERADVYSLGVMLYEMLSGSRPFDSDGEMFKLIVAHLNESPTPLTELVPDLPPGVEEVVMAALAKRSADRPTARDLARRFAEAALRPEAAAE